MKYYFITYQAINLESGSISKWNQVTDKSPMEFIKQVEKVEDQGTPYRRYFGFVVINTCEISEEDFNKYKDEF